MSNRITATLRLGLPNPAVRKLRGLKFDPPQNALVTAKRHSFILNFRAGQLAISTIGVAVVTIKSKPVLFFPKQRLQPREGFLLILYRITFVDQDFPSSASA